MLKRVLGSVTPVMLGLSLVLGGCTIPSDVDISMGEKVPAIDAAGDVKAVAYPGIIQVSWDSSKDAKSYDVYRRTYRDEEESVNYEDKFLANIPVGGNLFYNDIVSYTNQLRDGWEYEYTIVANSGQSTNGRAISHDDVVLNASARSNRVTAAIPARGTKLANPVLTLESYTGLQYNDAGMLVASWPKAPGAVYELTFEYKGNDDVGSATSSITYKDDSNTNPVNFALDPLGYYQFPYAFISSSESSFGKVEIRATFGTDYYLPSDIVEKAPDATPTRPSGPAYSVDAGFDAAFVRTGEGVANYSVGYVDLTWNTITGVAAATGYKVYKAELDNFGAVISSWTPVAGTPTSYFSGTTSKQRLKDPTVAADTGKIYGYILAVTGKNNGISLQTMKTVTIGYHSSVGNAENYANSSATDNIVFTEQYTTLSHETISGIEVAWPAEFGIEYTLYRAEVTVNDIFLNDTSSDNIQTVGTWTKLGTGTATVAGTVNGSTVSFENRSDQYLAFFVDRGMTVWTKNYAYKVEAKKSINGTQVSAKPYTKILNVAPYVTYSNLSITIPAQTEVYYPANVNVLHIRNNQYGKDITVRIYRRLIDGGTGTNFAQIASGITIQESATYEYIDNTSGLSSASTYEYKAVAVINNTTTELQNRHPGNIVQTGLNSDHPAWLNIQFSNYDYLSWTGSRTITPNSAYGANLGNSHLYYRIRAQYIHPTTGLPSNAATSILNMALGGNLDDISITIPTTPFVAGINYFNVYIDYDINNPYLAGGNVRTGSLTDWTD